MGVRLGRSLRAYRQAFGRYRLLRYRPKAFPCAPLPASPASPLRFATGDAGDAFAPETQPHPLPAARWAGARWRFSALPALRYRGGRRGSATDAPDAWLLALPQFPRVLFRCLASSASSGLSPLGRCRRFGSLAPALPAYVVLGSPARTADADGSSLPTTARPSSHVTLPATDDGRGHVPYGHSRDSLRLPPPP